MDSHERYANLKVSWNGKGGKTRWSRLSMATQNGWKEREQLLDKRRE